MRQKHHNRQTSVTFRTAAITRQKMWHSFFSVALPFLSLLLAVSLIPYMTPNELMILSILTLILYALTLLGITLGFHRLFTHRAFKARRPLTIVLGILGSMAAQGPIINWSADHRRHHSFGDISGDPHSPYSSPQPENNAYIGGFAGFLHAQFGWLFDKDITNMNHYCKDLLHDKTIMWLSNTYFYWVSLGFLIPAIVGTVAIGGFRGLLLGVLWGGFVRLFFAYHLTWAINSLTHMVGFRDYNTPDKSTNLSILGFIVLGEGWHNNHHAFPKSAKFGHRWWQLDIGWLFLLLFKKLHLATDINTPHSDHIKRRRIL